MKKQLITLLLMLAVFSNVSGQNFKVAANRDSLVYYLQSKQHPLFPNASAVVLYEIGSSETIGGLDCYRYEIAYKIYNAKDIGGLADVSIPKHVKGTVKKIKGVTYNYENGIVVETKIEKPDVIMESYSQNTDLVKFSMPGIKDGAVVTYSYEYIEGSLPTQWTFQKSVPVLYSRFNFNWHQASLFTPIINAAVPFQQFDKMKKLDASQDLGGYAEEMNSFGSTKLRSWVRRNVPAFQKVALMGHETDYLERVSLQYKGYSDRGYFFPYAETWEKYSKEVWYEKAFPEAFQNNRFLDEPVKEIIAQEADSMEMAKKLYYYVQKNIIMGGRAETILSKVFSSKHGSGQGISSLLCAMFRNAGFNSDLILLSQRGHDKLNELVPNPDAVTRLAVRVVVKDISYVLDPTDRYLPFGYLPLNCYNGYARILNKDGGSMSLEPSLAIDASSNTVYLNASDKGGNVFKFKLSREYGVYSGAEWRKAWDKDSTMIRNKLMESTISKGLKIEKVKVSNIDDIDHKVRLQLEGTLDIGADASILIFDPYLVKTFTENPLNETKNRIYPIEYEMIEQQHYKIYIQLNSEYRFDDYPVSKQIAFGNPAVMSFSNVVNIDTARGAMMIKYQYDNQAITLPATEAEELRLFYNDIIKTQGQKVIFKRKEEI